MATCADCEEERLARESSGVLADADEHIVALVRQDLLATLGPGFEEIAIEEAARLRLFAETPPEYEQRVVDDVQQRLHDEFADTTWPTCPRHPNHPLWYSGGWWLCSRDEAIARLGELASVHK